MNTEEIYLHADTAYDAGNFEEAFALFLKAAEHGDCNAMCRIALMYESGDGTLSDIEESIYWDLKAIEGGCNTSLLNLAITYRHLGEIRKSKHWLEKSLGTGDGEAALELAKLYSVSDKEIATVINYLNIAIASDNLTEASREEALELLNQFKP